jgi:hypothetical protein
MIASKRIYCLQSDCAQATPVAHALPQAPQFIASEVVSTSQPSAAL